MPAALLFRTALSVFSDLENATADLGMSTDEAGYLLGGIVAFTFAALAYLVTDNERGMLLFGMVGVAIATAVGWFDPWVPLLVVIALAALLFWPTAKGAPAT